MTTNRKCSRNYFIAIESREWQWSKWRQQEWTRTITRPLTRALLFFSLRAKLKLRKENNRALSFLKKVFVRAAVRYEFQPRYSYTWSIILLFAYLICNMHDYLTSIMRRWAFVEIYRWRGGGQPGKIIRRIAKELRKLWSVISLVHFFLLFPNLCNECYFHYLN